MLSSATVTVTSFAAALEERHLANLRFSEVTRALRALSSAYVERRETALAERLETALGSMVGGDGASTA